MRIDVAGWTPIERAWDLAITYIARQGLDRNDRFIADWLDLRVSLLEFTAERAAANATGADIVNLTQSVAALESAETKSEFQIHDYDFFRAMVGASGNHALAIMTDIARNAYIAHREFFAPAYPDNRSCVQHKKCLRAISEGDSLAARSAMRAYGCAAIQTWHDRPISI